MKSQEKAQYGSMTVWTSKGRKKKLSHPNYTNKLSLRRRRRLRKKIPSITTERGKRKKLVLPVVVLSADRWWYASEGRTLFFIFAGWRRWSRWVVEVEDRRWSGFWSQNYIREEYLVWEKGVYIYLIKRNKLDLKIKKKCWCGKLWRNKRFQFYIYINLIIFLFGLFSVHV